MRTKFIEASNRDQNWGKFMIAVFDGEELNRSSEPSPAASGVS